MRRFVFINWLIIGIIVFFASFKEQIILNKNFQKQVNYIFPEGWGFFTKNPRDLLMDVYKLDNNEIVKIDMSNHSLANKLGLSRKARVIGYEASMITNDIPEEFWIENTSNDIKPHLTDSTLVIKKKPYFKHLANGEYIFKVYRQVPYAWANKGQEKYNPSKFAKVRIE